MSFGPRFSKFFGIPVGILGMLYYASVAAAYSIFILFQSSRSVGRVAMFGLTSFSFLFPLYLTFIQAFNLKAVNCVWCLASNRLVSSFIFLSNVFTSTSVLSIPAEIFEEVY